VELLLNLAWLLLALPACWLWRRHVSARRAGKPSSAQALLSLGCLLVLLFPVISATDDLHAMRAEMEDSSISKRTVRQAASDRQSSSVNGSQKSAAMAASWEWWLAPQVRLLEVAVALVAPLNQRAFLRAGRAPPSSLL